MAARNFPVRTLLVICGVQGPVGMDNLFLTTLLASIVIGVLIIYYASPEG